MVNHVSFTWNIVESLRGPFRLSKYGSVVLPFTVLRRLDAVLADTRADVTPAATTLHGLPDMVRHIELTKAAGHQFYDTSPFNFAKLAADPAGLRENFGAWLAGISSNVRDIFDRFEFDKTLNKLAEKNKLFAVTEKFTQADFRPNRVSKIHTGLVFEELIRWANERFGDEYSSGAIDATVGDIVAKLAVDDHLLQQAEANTPHQCANSPALPTAYTQTDRRSARNPADRRRHLRRFRFAHAAEKGFAGNTL